MIIQNDKSFTKTPLHGPDSSNYDEREDEVLSETSITN